MSRNELSEQAKLIFSIVKDDIDQLKDLEPEELDFSDYFESLKPIICFYIDNRSAFKNDETVKKLLLLYSIEIAKKPGTSFWGTFFAEINRDYEQAAYKFIFNSIWECLTSLECKPYQNYNGRQLVTTLFRLTDADPDLLNNMLDFFIYYYKNLKGKPIGAALDSYSPCERYTNNKERRASIIHSTELLVKAIDDILLRYPNELENEEVIKDLLKNEYGIRGTWFSRKRITSIIKELINTITPPQFSKILKKYRDSNVIHPEFGNIPVRKLENQIIDYGKYTLHRENYTITPHFRISINDMKQWVFENVQEDKGFTYYKKNTLFNVSGKTVRKLCDAGSQFYIWCGSLPIGEEIEIDGIKRKREGFFWNPKLKMVWGDNENPPSLRIETGHIIGYFNKFPNKPYSIECQSQIKKMWADSHGSVFIENYKFDLSGNEDNLQVSCKLNDNEIKSAHIHLDEHMLFSSSSREQIKNQSDALKIVKRNFGEHSYYLFSSVNPEDINKNEQKNIIIDPLNQKFGRYNLFHVLWENPGRFILKIKENIWIFENQKYIQVFLNNNGLFESITEIQAHLEANVQNFDDTINYRILNCNYEQITNPIDIEFRKFRNNKYTLNGSSFLDEALENELNPGEYILELQFGDLSAQKTFYILPHINVKWPELISEGEVSQVHITSLEKSIRNLSDQTIVDSLSLGISGKVAVWGTAEKRVKSEDISVKFSYVNPPIVKELSPEKTLYVFGYRLYYKNIDGSKVYLAPLNELNYYDLKESILLIFSHPSDNIKIFINDKKVMSTKIDEDGIFRLDNLERFITYCEFSRNTVKILCRGFEKSFDLIWNPKILFLKAPEEIDSNKIIAELGFEGPTGSYISIDLKNTHTLLDSKKFDCHGIKEEIQLEFALDKNHNSYFYYLVCNISSIQGQLLPSASTSITNNQNFYLQISILDENNTKYKVLTKEFEDNIDPLIPNMVIHPKPIIFRAFAKSRNEYILKHFLKKLIKAAPKAKIVMCKKEWNIFRDKKLDSKVIEFYELLDNNNELSDNLLNNALNPIRFPDLLINGLGLTSKELLNNIESYLPKVNPIIFFDSQLIKSQLMEQIVRKYSDRTLIFLEKGE